VNERTIFSTVVHFLIVFLFCLPLSAQLNDDEFEQWKQKEQAEYETYREEVTAEYQAYVEAERKAFEEFKEAVMKKWDEFKASSDREWVEYDTDLNARSHVDFEEGTITVEAIVPADEAEHREKLNDKLLNRIEHLVTDKGSSADFPGLKKTLEAVPEKEILPEPILAGQLKTEEGKEVKPEKARDFAKEVIEKKKVELTTFNSNGNTELVKATVTFQLIPEHLKIRASKYKKTVDRWANKYSIDPGLIFAVIHTESYFNPKARSHVPAFGLMQLVPSSGARDAYLYVYKEDRLVDRNYLYDPENNVHLGTAYLHKNMNVYFKKIGDGEKALYCAICAYNTGPGNVAKAIYGGARLNAAIERAKTMSVEELYRKLLSDLPHQETRDYLEKVHSRIEIYNEWR
jgi:membrane-bound lytic murein transglycosylase C